MKKVAWFFSEFFVVLAGILVAFALNGWWSEIKEINKEEVYIRQIYDDLQSNIRQMEIHEKEQRQVVYAAAQLLTAVYSEPIPPDAEIEQLIVASMNFTNSNQLSATLNSLIASGDLQLIRNDSLRLLLVEISGLLEQFSKANQAMAFTWVLNNYERLADDVNIGDLRIRLMGQVTSARLDSLSGVPPHDSTRSYESPHWKEVFARASFRNNLTKLYIAQRNLWQLHKIVLDQLKAFEQKLSKFIQEFDD